MLKVQGGKILSYEIHKLIHSILKKEEFATTGIYYCTCI